MAKSNGEDEGRKIPIHVERNTTYYGHICNAKTKGVGARAKGIKKRTWGIKEVTMITKDKQLLLQDLCARLPYNVIVDYGYNAFDVHNGNYVKHGSKCILKCYLLDIFLSPRRNEKGEYIKPYLRPMSSMTEEEKMKLSLSVSPQGSAIYYDKYIGIPLTHLAQQIPYEYLSRVLDWLNAHHFDYRGLIEKGLAIEVTEENNPYKD